MPTFMPTDDNNNPIPALRLKEDGAHSVVVSATATRNTDAFAPETQIVSLYASVPVYIRFGAATVTATASDHYFPAGVYYDFAIGGEVQKQSSYLSVLRAGTSDGFIYISEKN